MKSRSVSAVDTAPLFAHPFRPSEGPEPADPLEAAVGRLALCVVAGMYGLHPTCPRRRCRQGCCAGSRAICGAEFPAHAADMVIAICMFAHVVRPEMLLLLQDR